MKHNTAKVLALALCMIFVLGACQNNASPSPSAPASTSSTVTDTPSTTAPENPTATPEPTTPDKEAVLRYTIGAYPETYNPHKTAAAHEYQFNMYISNNLYKEVYDPETRATIYIPELADGEPIPKDDTHFTWTIKIAKGYTFEDGTPIDAHTYEYTIKMLNDPGLANRNINAHNFVNGEKFLAGECEWEDVAFKAIDDYTIEFTYAEGYEAETALSVKGLFGWVGTCIVHPEMYESCFNADRTENTYGTSPDKFVASGAYRIVDAIEGQYIEVEKWHGGSVFAEGFWKPDRIKIFIVADANTVLQMYENGEIDYASASPAKYDEYPDLYYNYTPDNYGIFINGKCETNPVLQDINFRYAMYWGLDREYVVKAAYPINRPNPYHYPLLTTVPDPADPANKTLPYREQPYAQAIRMDGHELTASGFDKDLALEYFDKAYQANGGKKIVVEVSYSEVNELAKIWAEAIQDSYHKVFGTDKFEIKLKSVPQAVVYDNLNKQKLNYEIMAAGGVYENIREPWGNSNWVSSGADQYNTQYCLIADPELAAEWDELYYRTTIGDIKWNAAEKAKAGARMEEILYTDCCFLPAYARGVRFLIAPHITPPMDTNIGDPFLEFALLQATYE